ncbi:integral membrane protein [Mycolicibacterium llatzerense]
MGRMTTSATDRVAAETWFLRRGLPAVLRPGALVRRLWQRSAPALAGFAVFMTNSIIVVAVTGQHTINIDGQPTRTDWFILALLLLVAPVALFVGWQVSRISSWRNRAAAAAVSVAVCLAGAVLGGPGPRVGGNLVYVGLIIVVILACTATGIGSILGWALDVTAHSLSLMGNLFVRALPVMLLTVLVFFNTYVWLMAAIVSRARLWGALGFLSLIAVAFVIASTVDRVRPILTASTPDTPEAQLEVLADTPFAKMAAVGQRIPLSRIERVNVVFVLAMSQVLQLLIVALVTAFIFLVLGLILIDPKLLAEWTRNNGTPDGTVFGMTLPIPESLIQTTLFLGALTFMYITARTTTDASYREEFVDPQVDSLRRRLDARDRYLADRRQG